MTKLIEKFNQYERIFNLLEQYSIEELEENPSLLEGIDMNEVSMVNETINEALLDPLKNWISKKIPGTVLNKANKILERYKKIKFDTLEKTGKEMMKKWKARIEADDSKNDQLMWDKYAEISKRVEKSTAVIEKAEDSQMAAIEKQLTVLSNQAKTDRVKNYIAFKTAEIQEQLAVKKLKDAEKFASDDEIKQMQDEIDKLRKKKVTAEKKAKADTEKKVEAEKTEAAKPHVDDTWEREANDGTTQKVKILVIGDGKNGVPNDEAKVQNLGGTHSQFNAKLKSLTRKLEAEKKAA